MISGAIFLLLFASQDKSRAEFLNAVTSMDETRVRTAARALAASDSREAVDTLLDGYGICAQQIRVLWQDKVRVLQEVEKNSDFKIDTSTNPPTIPGSDIAKYERYQKAVEQSQQVERKIMRIEAVKRGIVESLATFKSNASVQELLSRLKSDPQWNRRAGIAEALGGIRQPEIENALSDQLKKDSEPQVRIAILDALRARKDSGPKTVAAVCDQLKHELWQMKVAAVHALKAIRSKEAVEPLIHALEKSEGRLRQEINDALIAITGVDKHGDATAWKTWWETNRQDVQGGRYTPRKEELPGEQNGGTTFYGIPVQSRNVIFVLDRSGSMEEPSDWEIPADVASGRGAGAPDIKKDGNRKIDVAKWQLKTALARLSDGVEFNVLFFNHEWTIFSPKMVKLNAGTRKAVFEFIDKLDPVGGTNVYDPLEKAFTFAGVGLADKIYKSNIDTIFLLTDGMPNAGQIPNAEDIVVKVREMNKLKKVRINTIGVFGQAEANEGESFLRRLAEDSGGRYISAFKKKR